MQSLSAITYESIIKNESFFGLRITISKLEAEIERRQEMVRTEFNAYIDAHEEDLQTDFYYNKLCDNCIDDCGGKCEYIHYPVLQFMYFFDDEEFFVRVIIDINKFYQIIVEGEVRILKVSKEDGREWKYEKYDINDNLLNNFKLFMTDITPMLDIYLSVINN